MKLDLGWMGSTKIKWSLRILVLQENRALKMKIIDIRFHIQIIYILDKKNQRRYLLINFLKKK